MLSVLYIVSIANRSSALAVKQAALDLARCAAISQENGLVPIMGPEILLNGDHGIERTFEVAHKVCWAEVFFYLAENNALFEGILLKSSMVAPGAESKDKASPKTVSKYTLKLLHRRVRSIVPGIMILYAFSRCMYISNHISFTHAFADFVRAILTKGGTIKIVNPLEIEKFVDKVITKNPKQLEQYCKATLNYKVMKLSKGKAHPGLLNKIKILFEKLSSTS
ncbi:hypothetical protein RIF29_10871 [Crotalaria pallida]|uniref:fructose-bisphosphate aldolase n=1 Tax=Crotalaria pallida TaxID=3830 RepID=A0AAN9FVN1_CROPI